jgi:hypothetical protein
MKIQQPSKIEKIEVEKLIPYARNSRTHSDAQVAQIAASIREFGFNNPVLIGPDNDIIAGHGRVLAARKLELTSIPCIKLGHLTENQKQGFIIADNRIAMNAGWDDEMLKLEIAKLKNENFNLDLIGFSSAELDVMIGSLDGEKVTNLKDEWTGMPEYEKKEICFRNVVVNFDNAEDVTEFFKIIGQDFTDKTKSIWFPKKEKDIVIDTMWIDEEAIDNSDEQE